MAAGIVKRIGSPQSQGQKDYRHAVLSSAEKVRFAALGAGAGVLVMTLFFKNPIMMLIGGCTGALLMPICGTKQKEKKVRKELSLEFRDALYGLVVSLRAGRSLEGAFEASLEDMSPASLPLLYEEWKTICGRIRIGVPAETALTDLARRSGIEEIRSFARSVEISKKAEGNITRILTNTIQILNDRIETRNQIRLMLSKKRMEQRIMTLAPAGIIGMLTVTAPDYLKPLYQTARGRLVMVICLLLTFFSIFLTGRLMRFDE